MSEHVTFPKPSRLSRDVAKWKRRVESRAERDTRERAQAAEWRVLSMRVRARDKDMCRVCGCQTTPFGKGDPRLWGACHHVVMRSLGGQDVLENLIWICHADHERIHRHELDVTGTSDNLTVKDNRA